MSHENNSKNDEEEDDLGGAADDVSYVKECCHLNFLVEMLLVILLQYIGRISISLVPNERC